MTTWNAANKDASITLSNGNLTAVGTASDAWKSVYATSNARHTGKWYFRGKTDAVDSSDGWMFGVGNVSAVTSSFVGSTANGICTQQINATNVYRNGSSVGTAPGVSTLGDYVVIAVDFDNNRYWSTVMTSPGGILSTDWNQVSGNPSTNTGGFDISSVNDGIAIFPGFSAFTASGANDQVTLDTLTTIVDATLAGFSIWDIAPIAGLNFVPFVIGGPGF